MLTFPANDERNHPRYGPCDGFGPDGNCSQCTGMILRTDGSIIDNLTDAVIRPPRLALRIRRAWNTLLGRLAVHEEPPF